MIAGLDRLETPALLARAGKYLDESPYRVWVLCGDSEMAEGSIWEALDKASHYKLSNLIAMVDVNRLGQRGPTDLSWDLETYSRRVSAFGARVIIIDGHNLAEIDLPPSEPRSPAVTLRLTLCAATSASTAVRPRIIRSATLALYLIMPASRCGHRILWWKTTNWME